jgi:hypothetical protein
MTNYVIIGDIHSQKANFQRALDWIDENVENPHIIQLGDLFDSRNSFSDSIGIYKTIQQLGDKITVIQSNHQWKLYRYLIGNKVTLDSSISRTISEFEQSDVSIEELKLWLENLPFAVAFKDQNNLEYRAAHAFFNNKLYVNHEYNGIYSIKEVTRKTRDNCLYGLLRRAENQNERVVWWTEQNKSDFIRVSGHYHTIYYSQTKKNLVLDGGCGEESGTLPIFVVNTQTLLTF